jgi:uncharacterized protein (DUF488 family)
MDVFTTGFTRKSAGRFFGELRSVGMARLLDVRLHNSSQLAGFTKRDDLAWFVRELCQADYVHEPLLAPTEELLARYRKQGESWASYEPAFLALMAERRVEERLDRALLDRAVLLCSEPTADRCHRRLVVEYLARHWGDLRITHL